MIQFLAKTSAQFAELAVGAGERVIYVTDTQDIYMEKGGVRIQIRDIVYLPTEDDKPVAPLNKLYYVVATSKLYYYSSGWMWLNQTGSDITSITSTDISPANNSHVVCSVGGITVTLSATPIQGDRVKVSTLDNITDTSYVTVSASSIIGTGSETALIIDTPNSSVEFIFNGTVWNIVAPTVNFDVQDKVYNSTMFTRSMFDVFYSMSTETPAGAYPLWTGELIANCEALYPDFYAKAVDSATAGTIRSVSQATYDSEVSTYGETGAFVIDTTAKSIRLPKITRFLCSLNQLSDIGTPIDDAIRNITGAIYTISSSGLGTGALYKTSAGSAANIAGSASTLRESTVYFDASRVVPTADENYPKHVKSALYIQVYNVVIPASAAVQAEMVGSIANKLNLDVDNISNTGKGNIVGLMELDFANAKAITALNTMYQAPKSGILYMSSTSTAANQYALCRLYSDSGGSTILYSSVIWAPASGDTLSAWCMIAKDQYYKVHTTGTVAAKQFIPFKGAQ